jgi:cell wall-associated NlpC family hydrolase
MSGRRFRLLRGFGAVIAVLGLGLGLAPTAAAEQGWDPTLPKLLSAGAPGDPVAVAQASLAFTQQAVEYVIARGGSQRGVPYSWGGGAINGPSTGVDQDAGKVGYDCSGFTRYAFAGVGVQIPKYSGDQYEVGRHIAPSQAKRGDLIFYGPGGSQHVAIYLGNGQMLESSSAAGQVTVSPLRTAGMTPYLTRIIET